MPFSDGLPGLAPRQIVEAQCVFSLSAEIPARVCRGMKAEEMVMEKKMEDKQEVEVVSESAGAARNAYPTVKFEVFGEEMIEKDVRSSGNSGRVYLPPEWVGRRVKIIRID